MIWNDGFELDGGIWCLVILIIVVKTVGRFLEQNRYAAINQTFNNEMPRLSKQTKTTKFPMKMNFHEILENSDENVDSTQIL